MKERHKSTPDDDDLAYDESARPVDRAGAVKRLALDGFTEIEPLLAELLHHDNFLLRGQAIKLLLSIWTRSRYIDDGVKMLHSDSEWEVRANAAFALSSFAAYTGEQRERIVRELLVQLLNDEDHAVQRRCYEGLLQLIVPERSQANSPTYFNRERDVDWELLKPYLDELQVPQDQLTV